MAQSVAPSASLSSHAATFGQVVALGLGLQSETLRSVLQSFYDKYKNSMTSNGQETLARPNSIQALTPYISGGVQAEFDQYSQAARLLNAACVAGLAAPSGAALTPAI